MGNNSNIITPLMFILHSLMLISRYNCQSIGIDIDRLALLKFKEGLEKDPEGFLHNWNETTPVCKWNGVVCGDDDGERVRELVLKDKGLEGTISPHLSNLSSLELLELSGNSLQGCIPLELSSLANLVLLGLQGNNLNHEIPQNFGLLSNLRYIDLSRNKLQGPLPSTLFYNCTQLAYIDLSNNWFTGTIPPQIGNHLSNLENLLLYLNQLSGTVPISLSNSTSTRELDLENNYLTGKLPSQIVANMPFLEALHLSYNNFSSDEENLDLTPFFTSISNLSHLRELELAANNLGGELPSMIGLLNVNLSQIHLEDNLIHGEIPKSIANLSNLTLLNLSNNFLNGSIPSEFSLIPRLERLCLSHNSLQGEIPAQLGGLSHLGLLDLSSNMLTGPIPASFENLVQLRTLKLNNNILSGPIPPTLGSCLNLNVLDLSHNMLTGSIPAEVASLSNMAIYFSLSNNLLTGIIPVEIGKMQKVLGIDLSSNHLSGSIPSSLGSCQVIQLLNLSHNSIQGQIPQSLGNLLSLFSLDLSSNTLSGAIPASLQRCSNLVHLNLSFNNFSGALPRGGIFDSLSVEGNPHICGSSSTSVNSCTTEKVRKLRSRRFLLYVVAGVSVSAFLLTICCVVSSKAVRTAFRNKAGDADLAEASVDAATSHPRITYEDLWDATGGFQQSALLGSGSFGHVYKGVLKNGTVVAIKVLQFHTGNSTKSFSKECMILKRIRHRNLMRIITACSRPDFKALVLPFMGNGSLESHLYPVPSLSLFGRLNICSDIAEGMAYLHHHSPIQVIHCDLKPSNVLLNDEMTALVSDFGIARLVTKKDGNLAAESISSTANHIVGTLGYMAPEYGYGRSASTKGDVYSFGVLVLELLTRKRPTDDMFSGGMSLLRWVKSHFQYNLEKVMDPSLVSALRDKSIETRKTWEVVILELTEIGLKCTQEVPASRPTMAEVADDLDRLKRYFGGDTNATFTSSHGISSSSIAGGDSW